MLDKLEEIGYYYEIVQAEGHGLTSELPILPNTCDKVSGEIKIWSVLTYGDFIVESYSIASKVPIAELYQHFDIARRLGIDKLEELLQKVKAFHIQMSKEEVTYVVKYTPISHMHQILTNLEICIEEEIEEIKKVKAQIDEKPPMQAILRKFSFPKFSWFNAATRKVD